MSLKLPALVAAMVLLLAACAQKQYPPAPPPADSGLTAPPGASIAPAASATGDASGWTSSYPYGTAGSSAAAPAPAPAPAYQPALQSATPPTTAAVPLAQPPAAPSPTAQGEVMSESELLARASDGEGASGPITVYSADESVEQEPFESAWIKPGAPRAQYQADIEACYRFAFSQTEHDMQIESDVAAARDDDDKGLGITLLTNKMNLYDNKRRRSELIRKCMEKQGYAPR